MDVLFIPRMIDYISMEDGGMILTGENRRTLKKKPVSEPLYPPQISTWINPGLRGERRATNRLSHGMALYIGLTNYF
jgi:hypothetical protein